METKHWLVWLIVLAFYSIILVALPEWLLTIFIYEREVLMLIWFMIFAIMCLNGGKQ